MDTEKLEIVLESLKSEKPDLPTSIKNAIEDVFSEFDNISDVIIYHLNDLDDFQNDIRLFNKVDIDMRGKHTGLTNNTWTFYGDIEHSLTEHINLVDEDGIIEEISTLEPDRPAYVVNPADWVVLVWEKVSWDADPKENKKELNRDVQLYIYAPYDDPEMEEMSPEDQKVEDIYNQIKEGE